MKKLTALMIVSLVLGIIFSPELTWAAYNQRSMVAQETTNNEVAQNLISTNDYYVASKISLGNWRVYHVPTCPAAKSIKPQYLVKFVSKTDANKAGYQAHTCITNN